MHVAAAAKTDLGVEPNVNHPDWVVLFISCSAADWGYCSVGEHVGSYGNTRSNRFVVFHRWSVSLKACESGLRSRWGENKKDVFSWLIAHKGICEVHIKLSLITGTQCFMNTIFQEQLNPFSYQELWTEFIYKRKKKWTNHTPTITTSVLLHDPPLYFQVLRASTRRESAYKKKAWLASLLANHSFESYSFILMITEIENGSECFHIIFAGDVYGFIFAVSFFSQGYSRQSLNSASALSLIVRIMRDQ